MGTFIDETGNRHGRLTVIERASNTTRNGAVRWVCRCDCGSLTTATGVDLRAGNTKSCGCLRRDGLVKDETGQAYGRLIVLKRVSAQNSRQRAHWLCKCECGNKKIVAGCDLRRGVVQSCGCLLKEQPQNTLPDGEAAFNRMYYQYGKRAADRKLTFLLSRDQFRQLTQQDCYYCGQGPRGTWKSHHNTGDYFCNGVDRKNNEVGYEIDNCVPCCTQCNYFKRDMGYAEFIEYIDRVAAFRGQR